jgi:lysophospholipase L1-like esterase
MGGNDILQKQPMPQLKRNLKEMISLAKNRGISVLLISVPDISLFGLSPVALYAEVAKEENIPLVSGLLTDILGNPSLKSDQIHPNANGYKKMAHEIDKALKKQGWLQ